MIRIKNIRFLFWERRCDWIKALLWEVDGTIVFFNEVEAVCNLDAPVPDDLELKAPKKKNSREKKRLI